MLERSATQHLNQERAVPEHVRLKPRLNAASWLEMEPTSRCCGGVDAGGREGAVAMYR